MIEFVAFMRHQQHAERIVMVISLPSIVQATHTLAILDRLSGSVAHTGEGTQAVRSRDDGDGLRHQLLTTTISSVDALSPTRDFFRQTLSLDAVLNGT